MWFKNRLTSEELTSSIQNLQKEHPNEHIEDVLLFGNHGKLQSAYNFKPENTHYARLVSMIDSQEIESLTQEQIAETLEKNDMLFSVDFLRKYAPKFDFDDYVIAYSSIIKNEGFDKYSLIFIRACGDLPIQFAETFKDTLKDLALEQHSKTALATYLHRFGDSDLSIEEIKGSIKQDLSNYTLFLQYPKSLNIKRIHRIYSELTPNELVNASKDQIRNWHYTPCLTKDNHKILEKMSRSQVFYFQSKDHINNIAEESKLFELVNDIHLRPFSVGSEIKKNRTLELSFRHLMNKEEPGLNR